MKIKGKKVLVVDDEPQVCSMIHEFLGKRRFAVEEAHDGLEALRHIRKSSPDLIILDVKMPRMDGFTFLRQIKSDSKHSKIPIIMLTIKSEPPNLNRGIRLGADFYLPKPFSLENLMEFIKLVIK